VRSLIFLVIAGSAAGQNYWNERVTTQPPATQGCVIPPAETQFSTPSTKPVQLYFEATVTANDALEADWIRPNGQLSHGTRWNQVAGNFCFTGATLELDRLNQAYHAGRWEVRVKNHGRQLFAVAFQVNFNSNPSNGSGSTTPENNATGGSVLTGGGLFVKPVDTMPDYDGSYRGVSGTGSARYSTLYRDNQDGGAQSGCEGEGCGSHPGVDLAVPAGTPVRAIADGWIDPNSATAGTAKNFAGGWNGGWGGLIVIRHDNIPGVSERLYSISAHLSSFSTVLQQRWDARANKNDSIFVKRGDIIGLSGGCLGHANAGNSTGCHLHFQIDRETQGATGKTMVASPWFPESVHRKDDNFVVYLHTFNPMLLLQQGNSTAPAISSVDRSTINANRPERIRINGFGFDEVNATAPVIVAHDGRFVGNASIVRRAPNQIEVEVQLRDAGNFAIAVRNRDGRVSNYWTVTVASNQTAPPATRSAHVDLIFNPNPVTRTTPAACGSTGGYEFTLSMRETSGMAVTLDRVDVGGLTYDLSTLAIKPALPANAAATTSLLWCRGTGTSTWTLHGRDAAGTNLSWSATAEFK
jgi:murein DD-endopeptidase MepM/ murein hydrolase activator NlpD